MLSSCTEEDAWDIAKDFIATDPHRPHPELGRGARGAGGGEQQ